MKYLIELLGMILSTDFKDKKLPCYPNCKFDDWSFINFELDPEIKYIYI